MAEKKKTESVEINADSEVKTTSLASILGITARRVQQLAQDGIFVPVKRGKYPLGDSVQRYIRKKEDEMASDDDMQNAIRVKAVNEAKLKEAKAGVAQIEVEELRGNMHRAEDVEIITNDMIYSIRSALTALPGRLALDVAEAGSAAEAAVIIRRETNKIMRELAAYEYDPDRYEERVRERQDWNMVTADEE